MPFWHAEAAHAQIPGSRLVRYDAGHALLFTKHQEVATAMDAFLAEHEAPPGFGRIRNDEVTAAQAGQPTRRWTRRPPMRSHAAAGERENVARPGEVANSGASVVASRSSDELRTDHE